MKGMETDPLTKKKRTHTQGHTQEQIEIDIWTQGPRGREEYTYIYMYDDDVDDLASRCLRHVQEGFCKYPETRLLVFGASHAA
jgi:hypothetical protein